MTRSPIEKLIQRQLHQWSRLKQVLATRDEPAALQRPIITVSRELGAGARELAGALAQRLDLEIHGVSIIERIAEDANLERRIVDALDERVRSQVQLWVEGVLERRIYLRDNYHVSLVRVIQTLAAHGGVLFIGRGANFVLGDRCALRVLLVAPRALRVANVRRYHDLAEDEASRRVDEADADRGAFIRTLFHADANDPHHYDLVINTERHPLERIVEICMTALEVRGAFNDRGNQHRRG